MLNRREIKIFLKNLSGRISRSELVDIISKNFNVSNNKIFPISLESEKGKNDVNAVVYIYENEELAKKYLARYRLLRKLPKEERKKIIEDEKAVKIKAKQAVAGE